MADYIQIHMLVSYPPSNLNRDDLGKPKTAVMGGTQRLRVSSQSLKRAWRTSDVFQEAFCNHMSVHTKEMGWNVYLALRGGLTLQAVIAGHAAATPMRARVDEKRAMAWGQTIAGVFGKGKKVDGITTEEKRRESLSVEQMVHFSPEEIAGIDALLERLVASGKGPSEADLSLLRKENTAVDTAMFGRMLASSPEFNCDAAVQVAHAVTVHKVAIEDDYFTAVDDLNRHGAGHVGQAEFAAGLFYAYLCINRTLLTENLGGDTDLANRTIRALVEAATKVGPTGKQNSFASRAYASYVLAERGSQQPRSLSVAFLHPIYGDDYLPSAVASLTTMRQRIETAYGACADGCVEMNAATGTGSLDEILSFVAGNHA